MHRFSIAFAASTLLLVSICSAQQTSDSKRNNAGRDPSPIGGNGTAVIQGSGAVNYIPIWSTSNYLLTSVMYQASGNIGVGTVTPTATLDVNGNVNSATTYGIGEDTVLGIGSAADRNLFLGVGAGSSNVAGSGQYNVFSGFQAGYNNTLGSGNTFSGYQAGYSNIGLQGLGNGGYGTFVGYAAGYSNTNGGVNTFFGSYAGFSNTEGTYNTFSGGNAGYSNTTGNNNTFTGLDAGFSNTSGGANSFVGYYSGNSNSTGSFNTFFGAYTGYYNTGSNNVFLGENAGGNNTTGNDDVYIANQGPSSGTESNTIRIGTQGTGGGQQNATYIAGIYGSTSSSGIPVYVNSNGQLGTSTSSLRFKEQVRDMGDSTNDLMKLRPVTFFYKPQYDDGSHALQYGLIAEEVAKVYPELVAYDNGGQPYSVRYQYLTTMLLNEAQKQYHRAQAEAEVITSQEQRIEELEQRLSRLEGLVRSQVQTVARERE
jgi:trimeric autotransporter adhesin